jgi:hypothetical protein
MASTKSALQRLGIEQLTDAQDPKGHASCIQIARLLLKSERRIIGLWPASDSIGTPAVAIQIGLALTELSNSTVAFVDANVRWPADLALEDDERFGSESSIFSTRWIEGSLAMLVPNRPEVAGASVPQLQQIIEQSRDIFAAILVDLTGFDKIGDHYNVISLLDGVVIVGEPGQLTDNDLFRMEEQVDRRKFAGVVLVGSHKRKHRRKKAKPKSKKEKIKKREKTKKKAKGT